MGHALSVAAQSGTGCVRRVAQPLEAGIQLPAGRDERRVGCIPVLSTGPTDRAARSSCRVVYAPPSRSTAYVGAGGGPQHHPNVVVCVRNKSGRAGAPELGHERPRGPRRSKPPLLLAHPPATVLPRGFWLST